MSGSDSDTDGTAVRQRVKAPAADASAADAKPRSTLERKREARMRLENMNRDSSDSEEAGPDEGATMEFMRRLPKPLRTSPAIFFFIVGYFVIWAGLAMWSGLSPGAPKLAPCIAFLHVPLLPLAVVWWRRRYTVSLDDVTLHYIAGLLPGVIVVYFFQYIASMILFAMHTGITWAKLAPTNTGRDWTNVDIIVVAVASYAAFSLPEEVFKYTMAKTTISERQANQAQVVNCVSAAVGFATGQGLLLMFIAHITSNFFPGGVEISSLMLALFGTPMHVITAYITGLKIVLTTKYDQPYAPWSIIATGTFFRGSVYFMSLLIFAATDTPTMALIPAVFALVFLAVYAKFLETRMPKKYLEGVSYLGLGTRAPPGFDQFPRPDE